MDRPIGSTPICKNANKYTPEVRSEENPTYVHVTVDSDYTNDTRYRKLVTGIFIKMSRGCVYYKTRFQPIVSLSSIEI